MGKRTIAYLLLAITLCSCAMGYRPIKPAELPYKIRNESEGLGYSYEYNVMKSSGNRKSARKEVDGPIKLIALKLENSTSRTVRIGTNVRAYLSDREVFFVKSEAIQEDLGQTAALYMLWSILLPIYIRCENNDCSATPIPIGVGIGLINVAIASGANKKFLAELKLNNLLDKEILPGQSVTGLLGIYSKTGGPLTFKVN